MAPLWGRPTPSLLARVAAGQVGGVILMGRRWTSAAAAASATAALQRIACRRGGPLLVGVDQEGGAVRRFRWAAPTEAAAAMHTPFEASGQASAAAAALRTAGVDVDFAPVADAIATPGGFLGTRSFARDPALAGALAAAFVTGLQSGVVAATAKHFPGLGSATVNTDDRPVTVRRGKAFLTARLRPFRDAIAAGAKLVMMSSASYPALDPSGAPAVFSTPIVTGLLRGELGFDGVVVTDALDAPTPARTPHAGARALSAGVDLLLYTSTAASERGYAQLVADAAARPVLRQRIAAAVARIRALKAWLAAGGGPSCS